MKGRIVNGIVVDVCKNPEKAFHPDLAAEFVEVAESARPGWTYDEETGAFNAPLVADAGQNEMFPVLAPVHFKMCFTSSERIAIKSLMELDAVVADFYSIVDDPRIDSIDMNLESIRQGITYTLTLLESNGIISDKETRISQVLAGTRL